MRDVVIEYQKDVPAKDGRRAFLKGERYTVVSADAAKAVHPDAAILGYVDGGEYGEKPAAAETKPKESAK